MDDFCLFKACCEHHFLCVAHFYSIPQCLQGLINFIIHIIFLVIPSLLLQSLPPSACEVQRAECLRSLREICVSLSERPARGDITGEVCHWADGYHLNVALYEKLLFSVFDMLDEGKLTEVGCFVIEYHDCIQLNLQYQSFILLIINPYHILLITFQEVDEILELLKSTWRILGITETIHDTCYAWVLFRQVMLRIEIGMFVVSYIFNTYTVKSSDIVYGSVIILAS